MTSRLAFAALLITLAASSAQAQSFGNPIVGGSDRHHVSYDPFSDTDLCRQHPPPHPRELLRLRPQHRRSRQAGSTSTGTTRTNTAAPFTSTAGPGRPTASRTAI